MHYHQLVAWSAGKGPSVDDFVIRSMEIDSRRIQPGDCFVACQGQNHHGLAFVADAVAAGATAVLSDQAIHTTVPVIVVDDVLAAMQRVGAMLREYYQGVPVVALTGSYGKTTTKNMLRSIATVAGHRVLATDGNRNNHWGVPLTLSRWQDAHTLVVLEMGANHRLEIDPLVALSKPDVRLITCAGPCHLEGFGDLDGVAQGKAEIYNRMEVGHVGVVNADDPYAPLWLDRIAAEGGEARTFGRDPLADIRANDWGLNAKGMPTMTVLEDGRAVEVTLSLLGVHHLHNALAASAVARTLGIAWSDIVEGLARTAAEPGRLALVAGCQGSRILDDTYNASPEAFKASIDTLMSLGGEPWVVMGDMGELGDQAQALHESVGDYMRQVGVKRLYTCGHWSAYARERFQGEGAHATHLHELKAWLASALSNQQVVLIKGSRSARLDVLVQELQAKPWMEG